MTKGVLVVIRGNSGSGKSTVARAVQQRFPRARCLVVPQDTVRRHMLRERDIPAAVNIDLIEHVATFGLSQGLIVIVEGILDADRYGRMLERLTESVADALHYCFDLSFEETLRRHARPSSISGVHGRAGGAVVSRVAATVVRRRNPHRCQLVFGGRRRPDRLRHPPRVDARLPLDGSGVTQGGSILGINVFADLLS
ncbi:kinase [Nocardia otitidiscaviarum]|uniref:AAA family ATPase n=1 Tax=Nocardia otitidiscaviarum TaxID=1823 RepID=UPI0018946239|nr:AAA family ATPase [Nocardia otitidiscaviarum]MBF6488103.1 kinase [Nocardia otitidiscaviarum]